MPYRYACTVALAALLLLSQGCTPPTVVEPAATTPPVVDSLTASDTTEAVRAVPPAPLCATMDALTQRATAAGRDGEFGLAHRLACTAPETDIASL